MSAVLSAIGDWVSSLRIEQVPEAAKRRVRMQVLSTLAAAHASVHSRAARGVLSTVAKWGSGGLPIVASGARVPLQAALFANACASMSLDYDDYLFLGHTGHSAVWTSLLLGAEAGASPSDVFAAIVAANEVAGRLGAACFYGPQNGQLWSFIHLAGAASAAARVLRLDGGRTAHALAIALSQPNYALFPGLLGCDAKLLTAATPAVAGLQAAQLAAEGLTGRLTLLEDPRGFLANFSFHPQPHMLTGWGEAWVSETIAVKPYPGCAYIDAAMDCVRAVLAVVGGKLQAGSVAGVEVDATLLTLAMERLGRTEGPPTPVTVNFSIPLSVAIALLEGGLPARAVSEENLERRGAEISALAAKVRLQHDRSLTEQMLTQVEEVIGVERLLGTAGLVDLLRVRSRMRQTVGHGTVGLRDLLPFLKRVPWSRLLFPAPSAPTLAGVAFSRLSLPIGARVTLRLADGRTVQESRRIPRGAGDDVEEVAREKWRREAEALGPERVAETERRVGAIESTPPREILDMASVPSAG